jgi:hypothetical protein
MDQIDAFVNRIPVWMDETGAEADPDLGVVRDLLESRAAVLELPDPWVWPKRSLWRTVAEAVPFTRPIDAGWRAALDRTIPTLRDFIGMEGSPESKQALWNEADEVRTLLAGKAAESMDKPMPWSIQRRLAALRYKFGFEPPVGEPGLSWGRRFDLLPWERQNELVGPIWRPGFKLPPSLWGDVSVPRPRITLPSTLVAAARNAPLMAAVVELAEYLSDRPGIWSGSRLESGVVEDVIGATRLTDSEAVQEAWRLAVLTGLLWPTAVRTFRAENLDLWSDPAHVLELWTDAAVYTISDLPDPLRGDVVRLMLGLHYPGADKSADQLAVVRASDEGRAVVDRLRRLGAIAPTDGDGVELTPLGVRGLLFRWTGWRPNGDWLLEAGEWQPDLTTADIGRWLTALSKGLIVDKAGGSWLQTADPRAFAVQLVETMLATDDGVERAMAFVMLGRLGSSVTPVLDRLVNTPLHAYRAFWPGAGEPRDASPDEGKLWLRDYLALNEVWSDTLVRLPPGGRVDPGRFDFPLPDDDELLAMLRHGGQLTAGDLDELRTRLATDRADFIKLLAEQLEPPTEGPSDR